jgi:TRAP transporter TAXI family solute receptor
VTGWVTRRGVLLGTLGLVLAGCGAGGYHGPERAIGIAAGEHGGLYLDFAKLLGAQLEAAEPRLHGAAQQTGGSLDNLSRLGDGRADLALVLADAAQAAAQNLDLRAVGRVYENYLQLVVRADSTAHSVRDLSGRVLSLGAPGSGAALFGDRMLSRLRLSATVQHLPLAEAVQALEAGAIDALLWSGGVPTPSLAELDARVGVRLLPLADDGGVLNQLRSAHGSVYEQVAVPPGVYRAPSEVQTVGVANLLVCRASLPDDVATAVVRVLAGRAAQLVPDQALGTQFLDTRSLIGTAGLPLHPGAAKAYRELHG